MDDMSLSLLYCQNRFKKINLKRLIDQIEKNENLTFERRFHNFWANLLIDKTNWITIYSIGDVMYTKKLKEEDINLEKLLSLTKESWEIIKTLPYDYNFSKEISLMFFDFEGNKNIFFVKHKPVIEEFGKRLFRDYSYGIIDVGRDNLYVTIRYDTSNLRLADFIEQL